MSATAARSGRHQEKTERQIRVAYEERPYANSCLRRIYGMYKNELDYALFVGLKMCRFKDVGSKIIEPSAKSVSRMKSAPYANCGLFGIMKQM